MSKIFTISKRDAVASLSAQTLGSLAYSSGKPLAKSAKFSPAGALVRNLASTKKTAAKVISTLNKNGFADIVAQNVANVSVLAEMDTEYGYQKITNGLSTRALKKHMVEWTNQFFPAKIEVDLTTATVG